MSSVPASQAYAKCNAKIFPIPTLIGRGNHLWPEEYKGRAEERTNAYLPTVSNF